MVKFRLLFPPYSFIVGEKLAEILKHKAYATLPSTELFPPKHTESSYHMGRIRLLLGE